MGAFVARQPNGLLCRFSTVVDRPTNYNMTEEEYVELCAEKARIEARERIANNLKPFEWVKEYFTPGQMTQEEFDAFLEVANKPAPKTTVGFDDKYDTFDNPIEIIDISEMNDCSATTWGCDYSYITQEQIDAMKKGKIAFLHDGEYGHFFVLKED